jgi:hypothetical protein
MTPSDRHWLPVRMPTLGMVFSIFTKGGAALVPIRMPNIEYLLVRLEHVFAFRLAN